MTEPMGSQEGPPGAEERSAAIRPTAQASWQWLPSSLLLEICCRAAAAERESRAPGPHTEPAIGAALGRIALHGVIRACMGVCRSWRTSICSAMGPTHATGQLANPELPPLPTWCVCRGCVGRGCWGAWCNAVSKERRRASLLCSVPQTKAPPSCTHAPCMCAQVPAHPAHGDAPAGPGLHCTPGPRRPPRARWVLFIKSLHSFVAGLAINSWPIWRGAEDESDPQKAREGDSAWSPSPFPLLALSIRAQHT